MPSPPLILRSTSNQDLFGNQSYCSAPAPKTLWIRRVTHKLIRSGKARKERSTGSDLTEENLKVHDSLTNNKQLDKCSPYYKGLLALEKYNLEKYNVSGTSSPGRESHATTVQTTGSSILSFVFKMKGWSFGLSGMKRVLSGSPATSTPPVFDRVEKKNARLDRKAPKDSGDDIIITKEKEKPLRERVSEADRGNSAAAARNIRRTSKSNNPTANLSSMSSTAVRSKSSPNRVMVRVDDRDSLDESMIGKEFVWASMYRPKALKDFICNREIALSLQGQIQDTSCRHFIFEGKPGVGKRTMIWAMLREAFGPEKIKLREERKVFELQGESRDKIEIVVRESTYHVEVSVSQLKGYEKHIIVELIKETHNKSSKTTLQAPNNCYAMILYEADRLSTDALLYIRWLLEKYKNTKVFFCCNDASKLQPISMLCSIYKLLPPSRDEIIQVLEFIANQEGICMPHRLAKRLADESKKNLRQAIRSFEATWQKSKELEEDQEILTGWEDDIAMIAEKITQEQSSKQLYRIRRKLQLLSEHNVSADFILAFLVQELKKHLDEQLQDRLDCLFDEYRRDGKSPDKNCTRNIIEESGRQRNESMKGNFQDFQSIEEFIARFMSCYKHLVTNKIEIHTI